MLADGPEGGAAWAILMPTWDEENGLRIETNEPEWVGLAEVYDHLRRQEMTWREWRSLCGIREARPVADSTSLTRPPSPLAPAALASLFTILAEAFDCEAASCPDHPLPSAPAVDRKRNRQASPYLDAAEAAAYLGLTVKALYGHVERRKLQPLPGYRHYRFTREQLDAFLRGERT